MVKNFLLFSVRVRLLMIGLAQRFFLGLLVRVHWHGSPGGTDPKGAVNGAVKGATMGRGDGAVKFGVPGERGDELELVPSNKNGVSNNGSASSGDGPEIGAGSGRGIDAAGTATGTGR